MGCFYLKELKKEEGTEYKSYEYFKEFFISDCCLYS
jgi:hypothetical protein